jgi:hypothetical protein
MYESGPGSSFENESGSILYPCKCFDKISKDKLNFNVKLIFSDTARTGNFETGSDRIC